MPDHLAPEVPQQPGHGRVVGRDRGGEAADALLAGPVGQPGQQLGAQAAALPVVDDGDGDLGRAPVVAVPDVPRDAHAAPAGVVQRAERLVVVVVDVGEISQLGR
jgi:hypothetical protein